MCIRTSYYAFEEYISNTSQVEMIFQDELAPLEVNAFDVIYIK